MKRSFENSNVTVRITPKKDDCDVQCMTNRLHSYSRETEMVPDKDHLSTPEDRVGLLEEFSLAIENLNSMVIDDQGEPLFVNVDVCENVELKLPLLAHVTKVKLASPVGKTATSPLITAYCDHLTPLNFPLEKEVCMFLKSQQSLRFTKKSYLRSWGLHHLIYNSAPAKNIWYFLVDILRTCIIFGFKIPLPRARAILLDNLFDYLDLVLHKEQLEKGFGLPWMKICKYRLALFSSVYKGSHQLPDNICHRETHVLPLYSRELLGFFEKFRKQRPTVATYTVYDTIARGVKKGCERPSDDDCNATLPGTFRKFTTRKPEEEFEIVTIRQHVMFEVDEINFVEKKIYDFSALKNRLQDVIRTYIPKTCLDDLTWGHFPSTSSCVENGVAHGGMVPIVKEYLELNGMERSPHFFASVGHVLFAEESKQIKIFDDVKCHSSSLDPVGFTSHSQLALSFFFPEDNLDSRFIENLAMHFYQTELPVIELMALSEALKVRGISKGNAVESWLLKPIQSALSCALGSHPQFSLTRGPVTKEILDSMFGDLPLGTMFLNGDYDDATNEMSGEVTRYCIQSIVEHTGLFQRSPYLAKLAVRSLCDNFVRYKEGTTRKSASYVEGQQVNAQPMGKILSFVCLCLINMAVCTMSTDIEDGGVALRDKRILINGDDCVFPLKTFSNWENTTPISGLKNSVGKTFHTPIFIEINSISFLRNEDGTFSVVPYVNWGLLKGFKRSLNRSEARDFNPLSEIVGLGAKHRTTVQYLPEIYKELTDLFLSYNRPLLHSAEVRGISWFLPEWLGGLGLYPNPDLSNLSDFDRKIAGVIFANYKILKVVKLSEEPEWLLHRRVNSMIESVLSLFELDSDYVQNGFFLDAEFIELKAANAAVYSKCLENVWKTHTIDQLMQLTNRGVNLKRGLFANAKIRRRAIEFLNHNKSDLLEWKKLWHQKQSRLYPIRLGKI